MGWDLRVIKKGVEDVLLCLLPDYKECNQLPYVYPDMMSFILNHEPQYIPLPLGFSYE